jgi:hypothetical protein
MKLAVILLGGAVRAHISLWHPAMYGFNMSDPWAWHQSSPLAKLNFSEWWFHGYLDQPPEDGYFMELPAGGVFHGEVASSKSLTTMGGMVDFKPRPRLAVTHSGDSGSMGGLHTTDKWNESWTGDATNSVKGCGLSNAYKSDVTALQPEDFVVISVNHTCPWTREVDFAIPEGLPPCPEGGCHCMWGWVPDPSAVQQHYLLGYRCIVTGLVGDKALAAPQVARKCPFEKNNCTIAAKQMHYVDQLERNNNNQAFNDPPFYNDDYGYQNGAQLDIWQVDDGANWIKNASDVAPPPRATLTKSFYATGGVTTYPAVTIPGTVVSTITAAPTFAVYSP